MPADREHRLRAADGWSLAVRELLPAGAPRGTVIAGHAMMVDSRTLYRTDRPCLAETLRLAGLRVLVPDLRGHGRSGPRAAEGGRWSYDDLVADTAAYVELAAADPAPIALLGHSLFAHTSLAWLGQRPQAPVRAHVALGMDIWLRGNEPSPSRLLVKRLTFAAIRRLTARAPYLPVRRLRIGSDDEPATYWSSMTRWLERDRWCAADGLDYRAGLARIRAPLLHVVSDGDRLLAHPDAAASFSAPLPDRELWRLGDAAPPQLLGLTPDHMAMVTDPASRPLWRAVAAWLLRALA